MHHRQGATASDENDVPGFANTRTRPIPLNVYYEENGYLVYNSEGEGGGKSIVPVGGEHARVREAGHLVVLVSREEEPRQHEQAERLRQQPPNRHHLPGKTNTTRDVR